MNRPSPAVLVVEDERIVARDIQQSLRELGYDAWAIAATAEEAIAHATARCPDLVFMDIRIKGARDGVETAQLLKSAFDVPIVFLTAHADEVTLDRAKKIEPHGYVLKPVRATELRSVAELALYKHAMEKQLKRRERWFSTTLSSIADAVLAVDLAGNVSFMNETAEKLIGTSAAEALGRPVADVLHLDDAPQGAPLLTALREGRTVELVEAGLRNRRDGASRRISDSASPVVDGGTTLGAVMVFRDVTETREHQGRLELADRLASLGTLAAGVAHEVNNPLAVVMSNTSYVRDCIARSALPHAERAALEEALDDLKTGATRIAAIVADLRMFANPPQPPHATIDVRRCIEWVLRSTAHEFVDRATVESRLVTVAPVAGDEVKLGHVLLDVLMNAAQAITLGEPHRHRVTVTLRMHANRSVIIEIADTGSGISRENLKRVFEPFFTTKSVGEGTGLGLSVSHGIISSMGGELRLESVVGQGTVVTIVLPTHAERTGEPLPKPGPMPRVRARILAIDDDPMVLRALKRALPTHDMTCVDDPRQGLRLLLEGPAFDLILCDLMMPAMTGIELYEQLLALRPDTAERVVFSSGGALTPKADAFLRALPHAHLIKPFSTSELLPFVEAALARGTAGALRPSGPPDGS